MRLLLIALCLLPLRLLALESRQLLVGIAPDWNSPSGTLVTLERDGRGEWRLVRGPFPVLFGKNGLAWGRGLRGDSEPGRHKAERDARSPAGLFRLGKIYTDDLALPRGARYPFHTLALNDAWVDNPALPEYNRFVTVDPRNPPPWFESQKMRHGDPAYRWLVEIRHNADPPVAGKGSAIFFHIRRGKNRPTWGCTSMAEADLVTMIRWLQADAQPLYVLLPRAEYFKKWKAWGLPSPGTVGLLDIKR